MIERLRVTTTDGKYTIIQMRSGAMRFLRHGEPWPVADKEFTHVGMILALAQDLESARNDAKPVSTLYRTCYMSDQGYVVYRNCFDTRRCSLQEGVNAHRQAVFIDEVAALEYCDHRNRLVDKNGSDAL